MVINSNTAVYVDDFVLLTPSASGLQLLLDTEVNKISLELNGKKKKKKKNKTKQLVFRARENKQSNVREIIINNKPIKRVFVFKYPGFIVNDKLWARNSFPIDFNNRLRKFNILEKNVKLMLCWQFCI